METFWMGTVGVAVLILFWFLWISRGSDDADPNTLYYRFHRAWRRLAFWLGDVRFYWQIYFGFLPLPGCSWTHHEYKVTIEDLLRVCKLLRPGDVMLATKDGYWFSNTAIPGCFKHAGIIVNSSVMGRAHDESIIHVYDPSVVQLVEAVSEGVIKHHLLYARADKMIFLRPKHMTEDEYTRAAKLALKFVGCKYDASFNFNIDEEVESLDSLPGDRGPEINEDIRELARCQTNHQSEFDLAFSCTETVAAAWWFRRRQLGIARKRSRGRLVITSDQFVNRDFKVLWTNVKVEEAKLAGLSEEGVRELEAYWEVKDTKDEIP
jgi:hypothetical protein